MFCGLNIALLLSTWFYYSVAFLLPSSYSLFSLLCGLFMAKMLDRHWLLIIMLWSGGAVNLRFDFGRHYAIFLTWYLRRNILASCDWIRAVLSSFWWGRWELSNKHGARNLCENFRKFRVSEYTNRNPSRNPKLIPKPETVFGLNYARFGQHYS